MNSGGLALPPKTLFFFLFCAGFKDDEAVFVFLFLFLYSFLSVLLQAKERKDGAHLLLFLRIEKKILLF